MMARTFASTVNPGELVIGDHNFSDYVDGVTLDGVAMGRGLMPRQEDDSGPYRSQFSLPLIPESEWKERIEEKTRTKTHLSDMIRRAGVPCKNQQSTSYCWIFAATSAVEVLRVVQGERFVSLSPASAGAPIKGYRNQGGWSTEGLRWIAEHGLVPSSLWPDTGINRQYDTEAARAERPKYKAHDWMEGDSRNFPQLVTCLLSNMPVAVGYNWWSHAIVALDAVILPNGEVGIRLRNSWGSSYGEDGFFVLQGNKKFAEDAVAPTSTTPNT